MPVTGEAAAGMPLAGEAGFAAGRSAIPARDDVRVGREVIRAEAAALTVLADRLPAGFSRAVDLVLGATGRLVVSGMGKSGHVGRKIAATFASTGTPAQFVHPAEASHGDLGMLTAADVALVLSCSGETPELGDLVSHTRRYEIPLVAIARGLDNTLMRAADVPLSLPAGEEACPLGLAPTTSTTASLALGDALAVAVMRRRQFTPQNFRMLHPGGQLGSRLLSVADLMHVGDAVPLVAETAPMSEALVTMSARGFGVTGVVDREGRLVGVISDGDLRRKMDGLLERSAGEVATRAPKVIAPDAFAAEALALMNAGPVLCLFVIDDPGLPGGPRPVGLIHIHDCVRAGIA